MTRQRPALAPPPEDPSLLEEFPRYSVATNRNLFRVTRRDRGPWWFDNSGRGRFDLSPPAGTCYVAFDDVGALREAIGPDIQGGVVSEVWANDRVLWHLKPPRTLRPADATAPSAAQFGVTLELSTLVPYDLSQLWARRLFEAGFGGIRYWLRHPPSAMAGLALFGAAGERKSWRRGRSVAIAGRLAARLERETGIAVAPIPTERQLRIIESIPTAKRR